VARRPPCADNQILPLIAAMSWQRWRHIEAVSGAVRGFSYSMLRRLRRPLVAALIARHGTVARRPPIATPVLAKSHASWARQSAQRHGCCLARTSRRHSRGPSHALPAAYGPMTTLVRFYNRRAIIRFHACLGKFLRPVRACVAAFSCRSRRHRLALSCARTPQHQVGHPSTVRVEPAGSTPPHRLLLRVGDRRVSNDQATRAPSTVQARKSWRSRSAGRGEKQTQ
jgi:hypothetical protein